MFSSKTNDHKKIFGFLEDNRNSENLILLDDRTKDSSLQDFLLKKEIQGHLVLKTSGTSHLPGASKKYVTLSKNALLKSALSVNKRIAHSTSDTTLNTLPCFHIGGISTFTRCFFSQSRAIQTSLTKWDPKEFIAECQHYKPTLTSLVPTQLYDLVSKGLHCPSSLRGIFIGGGPLNFQLYLKSKELNYPIFLTYGSTETASQIALNTNENIAYQSMFRSEKERGSFPPLKILEHMNVEIVDQDHKILPSGIPGTIRIQSPSLFTHFIFEENGAFYLKENSESFFMTQDIGYKNGNELCVVGRKDHMIKINGEKVSIATLNQIASDICCQLKIGDHFCISYKEDRRKGNTIVLVCEKPYTNKEKFLSLFQSKVRGIEKISQIFFVEKIPRTALGKVQHNKVRKELILVQNEMPLS